MESNAGTSRDPYFCPNQRTDNLARLCQLILTICTDILRDVLSKYISPINLENELNKNKSLLEKIFNKHQNIQIFPAANASSRQRVRSKDFDISVLYILLRNICGISAHSGSWGNKPHNGDYSTSACIERIRIERNIVSAHASDGGMDKSTFMTHWKELKECIMNLEENETGGDMYERGIDCLYESDLNPTKTKNCIEEMKIIKDELGITKGEVEELKTTVVGVKSMVGKKMGHKAERIEKFVDKRHAESTEHLSKEIEGLRMELKRKTTDEFNSIAKKIKDEFKALNSRVEELETNQCSTVHDRMNGLEENLRKCEDNMKNEMKRFTETMENSIQEKVEHKLDTLQQSVGEDISSKMEEFEERLENIQTNISDDSPWDISLSAKVDKMDEQLENIQYIISYGNDLDRSSISDKIDNIHREIVECTDDFDDSDDFHPYPKKKNINTKIKDINTKIKDRLRDVEKNITDVMIAQFHEVKGHNKETERDTQSVKALNLKRPKVIVSGANELWTIKATNSLLTNRRNEKFCQFANDGETVWTLTEYFDDSGFPIRYKWYQFKMSEDKLEQINQITVCENNGCGVMDIADDRVYFFSKSQNSVRCVEAHKTPRTLFYVQKRVFALYVSYYGRVLVAWDFMASIQLSMYNTNGTKIKNISTALAANQDIRRLTQIYNRIYILQNDLNALSDSGNVIYTIRGGKDPHQIRDISRLYIQQHLSIAYQKSIDVIDERGDVVRSVSFEGNDTIKSIYVGFHEIIVGWESNILDVYEKPSK